jgi:hypothetical protein
MTQDGQHTQRDLPRLVRLLLLLVLLPLVVLLLSARLLYAVVLQLIIWLVWCSRGRNVLLVSSESPIWHDYIETHILPRLPQSTTLLNWSERSRWNPFSLPFIAFRFFGGDREFNPMVIVFRPFRWAKTFRFWRAFRDYKHGKHRSLEDLEREMFQYLEHASRVRSGATDRT